MTGYTATAEAERILEHAAMQDFVDQKRREFDQAVAEMCARFGYDTSDEQ